MAAFVRLAGQLLVAGCLFWSAGSSIYCYPHSLSYFNDFVGGPDNGSDHLVDSNLDWGQDLFFLKKWYDKHPQARPFYLAYFGLVDPRFAGIDFEFPGRDRWLKVPGVFAVSLTLAKGYSYAVPNGKGELIQVKYLELEAGQLPARVAGFSIRGTINE